VQTLHKNPKRQQTPPIKSMSQIVKIRDLIVLWVQKSSVPISLLGLIYLATYAVQVLNQKNVALVQQMELVSWVIWFIFWWTYCSEQLLRTN
jgi:hypothetical protein